MLDLTDFSQEEINESEEKRSTHERFSPHV
jgi:hypothetical protein